MRADSEALADASLVALLGGAAAVHLAHGDDSGAGASVALRVGLPVGAGLLAMSFADTSGCEGSFCGFAAFGNFGVGMAIGYAAAIGIDAAYLSYQERAAPPRRRPSLAPTLARTSSGLALGLGGAF